MRFITCKVLSQYCTIPQGTISKKKSSSLVPPCFKYEGTIRNWDFGMEFGLVATINIDSFSGRPTTCFMRRASLWEHRQDWTWLQLSRCVTWHPKWLIINSPTTQYSDTFGYKIIQILQYEKLWYHPSTIWKVDSGDLWRWMSSAKGCKWHNCVWDWL